MNFWLQSAGLCVFAYLILTRVLKKILHMYFPAVLHFLMKIMHTKVKTVKNKLFDEAFEKLSARTKNGGKLQVLEIGIGTGENFRCLPPNSNITVLDKTDIFLPYLKESIQEHRKDLTISDLVVCSAEDMNKIESNSMDAVMHTFVLCSIPNSNAVLNEIHRVLK